MLKLQNTIRLLHSNKKRRLNSLRSVFCFVPLNYFFTETFLPQLALVKYFL